MPSAMHMQRCNELTWDVSGISLPTSLSLPCPALPSTRPTPCHCSVPATHPSSLSDHASVPERPCPVATLRLELETTTRQTFVAAVDAHRNPLLSVLVLRDTTGCHVG